MCPAVRWRPTCLPRPAKSSPSATFCRSSIRCSISRGRILDLPVGHRRYDQAGRPRNRRRSLRRPDGARHRGLQRHRRAGEAFGPRHPGTGSGRSGTLAVPPPSRPHRSPPSRRPRAKARRLPTSMSPPPIWPRFSNSPPISRFLRRRDPTLSRPSHRPSSRSSPAKRVRSPITRPMPAGASRRPTPAAIPCRSRKAAHPFRPPHPRCRTRARSARRRPPRP